MSFPGRHAQQQTADRHANNEQQGRSVRLLVPNVVRTSRLFQDSQGNLIRWLEQTGWEVLVSEGGQDQGGLAGYTLVEAKALINLSPETLAAEAVHIAASPSRLRQRYQEATEQ